MTFSNSGKFSAIISLNVSLPKSSWQPKFLHNQGRKFWLALNSVACKAWPEGSQGEVILKLYLAAQCEYSHVLLQKYQWWQITGCRPSSTGTITSSYHFQMKNSEAQSASGPKVSDQGSWLSHRFPAFSPRSTLCLRDWITVSALEGSECWVGPCQQRVSEAAWGPESPWNSPWLTWFGDGG